MTLAPSFVCSVIIITDEATLALAPILDNIHRNQTPQQRGIWIPSTSI